LYCAPLAHFFELRGAEVGDDAVEGVVGDGFVVGFLHPSVEGMAEVWPLYWMAKSMSV